MRLILMMLALAGCANKADRPDCISRDHAEQILRDWQFDRFTIGVAPSGWAGTATRTGQYQMDVSISCQGVIDIRPTPQWRLINPHR